MPAASPTGNQPPFHRHHQKLPERACRRGHAHGPRAPSGAICRPDHAVDHGVGGARLRGALISRPAVSANKSGWATAPCPPAPGVQNGTPISTGTHQTGRPPCPQRSRSRPTTGSERNRKGRTTARPAHLLGDGLQPQAKAVAHAHGQVTMAAPQASTWNMDSLGGFICIAQECSQIV